MLSRILFFEILFPHGSFIYSKEILLIFGVIVGATLGFGFPSILAFLADSTTAEERGRIAAFVIFTSYFLYLLIVNIIDGFFQRHLIVIILILIGLKSIGFFSFILDSISKAKSKAKACT